MIYTYNCFSLSILKKHSGFTVCPKNNYAILVIETVLFMLCFRKYGPHVKLVNTFCLQ